MGLAQLIEALCNPTAYPHPTGEKIEVRQTHISLVFLAGDYVYKIKKPVDLGFLDFTTLEKRLHFCRQEVALNRRLAPEVYLGVVPVVRTATGLQMEGEGEAVEWAVKMLRLADDATIQQRLRRDEVKNELVEALARKIALFHKSAESNERISTFGRFESVSHIILDVFTQARAQLGTTVGGAVFERIKSLMEQALARLRPLIESRASRGLTRDCHGDLHLDHVYFFPDRRPPADLVIIDCIEFNERFRFIDPVADMAFPVMDFAFHGRRDLARIFTDTYFDTPGDQEGRVLLPLYTAYRAAVRGTVEGLLLVEAEVPEAERAAARARAQAHWLLALTELEEPRKKPCLLLMAGLPGTGKSTLAHRLADSADFCTIRSDVVRKELAGLPVGERRGVSPPVPLYGADWNERTYAECLRRAGQMLFEGQRVLVDANFREEQRRRAFLQAANRWGVPAVLLLCQCSPETAQQRLQARRGDASDADWSVYLQLSKDWEEISPSTQRAVKLVSTEGSPEQILSSALGALRQVGLVGDY